MRGRPRSAASPTSTTTWQGPDGRWYAKVTVGRRLDGERDRRRISRRTKRELDIAVRLTENARDEGQQPWLLENINVEEWLTLWLESILPMSVRWKTLSGYASLTRVHVIPHIGRLPLTEVRPETLETRQIVAETGGDRVRVFGSVATGQDRPDSDVDLLFTMGEPLSLMDLGRLEQRLEATIGAQVDLVPDTAIRPELRDRVLAEAVAL